MPTELERFRDHAHTMAKPGAHVDDCHATTTTVRGVRITNRPDPDCPGCVPKADRVLFSRLAREIDAYLAADTCPDCGQPRTAEDHAGLFEAVTLIPPCCTPEGTA